MTALNDRKGTGRNIPVGPYSLMKSMLGREPDKGVRNRIEEVRARLGARDDDAIWVVLGIFESVIDRAQRAYRAYVWGMIAAATLVIVTQIASVLITRSYQRSFETDMYAEVKTRMQLVPCDGIAYQETCEIAWFNASDPARRALSGVIARLPGDQANQLAALPNLDQWLAWVIKSASEATMQSTADAHKSGKSRDGR